MLDWVLNLFLKHFQPILEEVWNSIFLWRTISLGFLFLSVVVIKFRNQLPLSLISEKQLSHDKKIFEEIDKLMTEKQFLEFLDNVVGDHSYRGSESEHLYQFIRHFQEEGNNFLIKDLRKKTADLHKILTELRNFLVTHFFLHPPDQNFDDRRYQLYPNHIDSQDPKKLAQYESCSKQLTELAKTAEEKYVAFRKTVKRRLFI